MSEILFINTGGTLNKIYNPIHGSLDISTHSDALQILSEAWLCQFKVINIIHKDSLDINDKDRELLVQTIKKSPYKKIIIIHGTDTMEKTAQYLDHADLEKQLILTGAMVPYSINPVEATANVASAYGYLIHLETNAIYISMHGLIKPYTQVTKERKKGIFIPI